MIKPELKAEAIRLRIEERLSQEAITKKLKISSGSCSLWLRAFPLTEEEIRERNSHPKRRNSDGYPPSKKLWGAASKHYRKIDDTNQKGQIAETAVAFRLALHGLDAYRATGTKFDFIVSAKGRLVTLQVKWARITPTKPGLPSAPIRCSHGRKATRKYVTGEFDFLVVYNLYDDTAYIFPAAEVIHKTSVSIRPDAAERWELISGEDKTMEKVVYLGYGNSITLEKEITDIPSDVTGAQRFNSEEEAEQPRILAQKTYPKYNFKIFPPNSLLQYFVVIGTR
jgi:hypothetical protein